MNNDLNALVPQPDPSHRRKGKVARLPKQTRDQINNMILDGVAYPEIIRTLGEPVDGVNEDCLSTWKLGGYQDWLRQQQRIEHLNSKHELALDIIRQNPGTTMQEASRQIVAAQLCQLMLDFDPTLLLEHLQEKPELYPRLIAGLARLSEGELACAHHRAQEALLKAKLAKEQTPQPPGVMTAETLSLANQKLNLH